MRLCDRFPLLDDLTNKDQFGFTLNGFILEHFIWRALLAPYRNDGYELLFHKMYESPTNETCEQLFFILADELCRCEGEI